MPVHPSLTAHPSCVVAFQTTCVKCDACGFCGLYCAVRVPVTDSGGTIQVVSDTVLILHVAGSMVGALTGLVGPPLDGGRDVVVPGARSEVL